MNLKAFPIVTGQPVLLFSEISHFSIHSSACATYCKRLLAKTTSLMAKHPFNLLSSKRDRRQFSITYLIMVNPTSATKFQTFVPSFKVLNSFNSLSLRCKTVPIFNVFVNSLSSVDTFWDLRLAPYSGATISFADLLGCLGITMGTSFVQTTFV